jgi:hypothetical protein
LKATAKTSKTSLLKRIKELEGEVEKLQLDRLKLRRKLRAQVSDSRRVTAIKQPQGGDRALVKKRKSEISPPKQKIKKALTATSEDAGKPIRAKGRKRRPGSWKKAARQGIMARRPRAADLERRPKAVNAGELQRQSLLSKVRQSLVVYATE